MQEETTCPICIEPISLHTLELCGHSACILCFKRWFEECERTGQALPTCPTCRNPVPVNHADVHLLLGRSFEPSGRQNDLSSNEEIDELTQQWLSTEARQCQACGSWVVKSDGCDKMQCICGYRFCFQCGMQGATCTCTPPNHIFWDNILQQDAWYTESPVATPEELQDMRSFMTASAARARELIRKVLEAREKERREQLEKIRKARAETISIEIVSALRQGDLELASRRYMLLMRTFARVQPIDAHWAEELNQLLASRKDVDINKLFPGIEEIASSNATEKSQKVENDRDTAE